MGTSCVDIYTHRVKSGREADFQKLWHKIANYFVSNDSAKAATLLHRTDNNTYISIGRWPTKKDADEGWSTESKAWKEIPPEILKAIQEMKACVDQTKKEPRVLADAVDSIFKD